MAARTAWLAGTVVGLAWTMLLLGVAWARALAPDGTSHGTPADD
ncbi:hypothetical protein [Halomarina litorea]|nr:hypothetical protein [Halomarina sp. BCD28]